MITMLRRVLCYTKAENTTGECGTKQISVLNLTKAILHEQPQRVLLYRQTHARTQKLTSKIKTGCDAMRQ